MDYITVREAAEKWGITERWVQKHCEQNRIKGAVRFSCVWMIPKNTSKPVDGRLKYMKTLEGADDKNSDL